MGLSAIVGKVYHNHKRCYNSLRADRALRKEVALQRGHPEDTNRSPTRGRCWGNYDTRRWRPIVYWKQVLSFIIHRTRRNMHKSIGSSTSAKNGSAHGVDVHQRSHLGSGSFLACCGAGRGLNGVISIIVPVVKELTCLNAKFSTAQKVSRVP